MSTNNLLFVDMRLFVDVTNIVQRGLVLPVCLSSAVVMRNLSNRLMIGLFPIVLSVLLDSLSDLEN